jgi:hypothetical protein
LFKHVTLALTKYILLHDSIAPGGFTLHEAMSVHIANVAKLVPMTFSSKNYRGRASEGNNDDIAHTHESRSHTHQAISCNTKGATRLWKSQISVHIHLA